MSSAEWSNVCLIINALLWITTFALYQYKTRYFGVGSGILLLYTAISIMAIHTYSSDDYSYLFGPIKFFPFLYLLLMILLACYPILSMNESDIKYIQAPSKRLFNVVCWLVIIGALGGFPEAMSKIKDNLLMLVIDDTYGENLYHETLNESTLKTSSSMNIVSIMSGICCNISPILLAFYTTQSQKKRVILIGLCLATLLLPVSQLASGSRNSIAICIINVFFLFIFIRNIIPVKLRRQLIKWGCLIAFILMIPFVSLSISRKGGNLGQTIESMVLYGTEGVLLFNNYGLDPGGTRNGDYTAVAFKKIVGLNPAMYYTGRITKYSHMKINESQFYTFVGDFTLDYGPILAILIFIATAVCFKRALIVRNKTITLHQLMMFYLLMVGCLGYFQWPLGREGGNLQLIAILLLVIIFKIDHDLQKHKIKI